MTLKEIQPGQSCIIKSILTVSCLGQRLFDLGLLPGQKVLVLRNAPLKDPIEVQVANSLVSLRRDEARQVLVEASYA
ncbi:MAG: FeoA family protein [Desulfohalobiaceae bacterium]